MRRLLELVGDPHLGLMAVHIAGSKGKGSTAAMLAEMLQAAGYRTGLYTSPHLERIEERMRIGGAPCPAEAFCELAATLQPAVEQVDREEFSGGDVQTTATFFEITTAMAFLHFARLKVDVAVLEVGLGGRLDSTNLCVPEVTIITSISFDHMRQLGHTLAAIASEKAGIVKPGVPVISGVVAGEPRQVIAERAQALAVPLFQRGMHYDFATLEAAWPTESFDYREPAVDPSYRLDGVKLAMLGRHQAANASAAICAVQRLRERGWQIGDGAVRGGLAAARTPARIELIAGNPPVILDVAHNPASIEALLAVLRERFSDRAGIGRRILVFASSMDKDHAAMLRRLVPDFDAIVLTRYVDNPRAMDPEGLLAEAVAVQQRLAPESRRAALDTTATPAAAWDRARQLAGPSDLIVCTGSFFLAAELQPLVRQAKVESPVVQHIP
jgi:dihydrofolate synthase/folylpolyglutamate synthase